MTEKRKIEHTKEKLGKVGGGDASSTLLTTDCKDFDVELSVMLCSLLQRIAVAVPSQPLIVNFDFGSVS